jgi:hypothetical protein
LAAFDIAIGRGAGYDDLIKTLSALSVAVVDVTDVVRGAALDRPAHVRQARGTSSVEA